MKIGDEVWVHGYIDEIRQEMCVIKNTGGYFATVKKELCHSNPNGICADPIKIGDEVITTETDYLKEKGVVIQVTSGTYPYNVLFSDGDTQWFDDAQVKRTGRAFPQIVEVLEQLQENNHE